MLKKMFSILLCSITTFTFAYNIEDYTLFHQGKTEYQNNNFQAAEVKFSNYYNNFSVSFPITTNYAYYYFGMNYYKLNNIDKAIYFLEQAVYIPRGYYSETQKKANFFQYQRDFYLGKLYREKGNIEKSDFFLKNLILNYYSPLLEFYEKQSLQILSQRDPYYSYIYEIKYNKNLSFLNKIKINDLISIGEFFLSKKDFSSSETTFSFLIHSKGLDRDYIFFKYYQTLFGQKKYEEIIQNSKSIKISNDIHYIVGLSYEELKDYSSAIYHYSSVKYGKYLPDAITNKANIYFLQNKFSECISTLSQLENQNFDENVLYINAYIQLKNKKRFLQEADKFIKKYPFSLETGIYTLIADKIKNNDRDAWNISNYDSYYLINLIVNRYIFTLKPYSKNTLDNINSDVESLFNIASLGDSQLLALAIENNLFAINPTNISGQVTVTDIYESGEFYDLALENSKKYKDIFYSYSDLIFYLFPKYYAKPIAEFSKKYDVPTNLVYAIILSKSGFNPRHISEDSKVGIMEVYKNGTYSIETLLDPYQNLEIGIKKLADLYKKYKNDNLKTLIGYSEGSDVVSSLSFTSNGDIDLNKIENLKLRKNIQELMVNFAFYDTLYN